MHFAMFLKHLLVLVSAGVVAAAPPQNKPAPLPEVPEILKPVGARIGTRKDGGITLTLNSTTPLTAAQWDAVAKLGVRSFNLQNAVSDDAGMARLAAMNPERSRSVIRR